MELIERTGSTEQNFADVYDGTSVQGYFHFAVEVTDLDTTYDDVLSAGATSVSAPAAAMMLPGLRYAYVKDPEGDLIELLGC